MGGRLGGLWDCVGGLGSGGLSGAPARGVNENSFNEAYLSAVFIETVQERNRCKIYISHILKSLSSQPAVLLGTGF